MSGAVAEQGTSKLTYNLTLFNFGLPIRDERSGSGTRHKSRIIKPYKYRKEAYGATHVLTCVPPALARHMPARRRRFR